MADVKPSVKDIRNFFEMDLAAMKREWMGKEDGVPQLTARDKQELGAGLASFYALSADDQTKVLNRATLTDEHKKSGVLTY